MSKGMVTPVTLHAHRAPYDTEQTRGNMKIYC